MAVQRLNQDQIATEGSAIDDTLTPTDHDANAVDLADSVAYLASQIADITGEVAWETAPDATIAALTARQQFETTNALREQVNLTDVTVPGSQNYKILSVGGGEISGSINKAIGAGTTLGLVTATNASFGSHGLDEVAGDNALNPKNLVQVVEAASGDPLLSSGRRIWALLQNESGATDGAVFTDTTPERAQVSFVRPNAAFNDLEACPVADIENQDVLLYTTRRRLLSNFVEQDYLFRNTAGVDIGSGAASVTLDNAIDNQGATPATQVTDIFVRIDDAVGWYFQTSDGGRDLLAVLPAGGGDEVEINVDTLDVNVGAGGVIDFDNGATVDSGGTAINLGVTAGQVDAAALKVASTAGALELEAVGGSLILDAAGQTLQADAAIGDLDFTDDSHLIMTANDAGAKTLLIAARNAGAGAGNLELEADDDVLFETVRETTPLPLDDATAGAISGLPGGPHASVSAAILYAIQHGGVDLATNVFVAGSAFAQGVNIPAATLDLTVYTLNMAATPNVFLFLNGKLLRGAASAGGGDVYPGDTPASGDIKIDFPKGIKSGDVIISIGLISGPAV